MNYPLSVLFFTLFMMVLSGFAAADKVNLTLGLIRAGGQQYFVDLLQQSLESQGHSVDIKVLGNLPQKRMLYMMEQGELSLTWLVQSKKRDNLYVPVEMGITNGLIGHRILLIPKGQQKMYSGVSSLEEFRQLGKKGVFGEGWYDVEVWKYNQLPYTVKTGAWQKSVYRKIAEGNRGVDYFSRGFFEVTEEAEAHPYLDIESRLLLIYDRDFRYYLSHQAASSKPLIETALQAAKASGLMDRLIRQHWSEAFKRLQLHNRQKIYLPTPPG